MTTEPQNRALGALSPQDLAAQAATALAALTDRPADLEGHIAVIYEAARRYAQEAGVRHRLVVIAADKDTDYCYLDVTKAEALAQFDQADDSHLYNRNSPDFKVTESEIKGGFMLWRNMGSNMADILGQRGLPAELANLLRGGPKR